MSLTGLLQTILSVLSSPVVANLVLAITAVFVWRYTSYMAAHNKKLEEHLEEIRKQVKHSEEEKETLLNMYKLEQERQENERRLAEPELRIDYWRNTHGGQSSTLIITNTGAIIDDVTSSGYYSTDGEGVPVEKWDRATERIWIRPFPIHPASHMVFEIDYKKRDNRRGNIRVTYAPLEGGKIMIIDYKQISKP